ncbi:MAG: glycosyltransferase [Gemmatimonadota bacterium]|nr:glycosyltransferase [Gemmatimonadota bacterium]
MGDWSLAGPANASLASIVVPVYNGAATVGECVASLLAMRLDRARFEIVVVDNGSTDATLDMLRGFGDQLRVLGEPTRGAAAARNRGIREALGRVVAFTDADCVVDEEWLGALLESLADPTIGVVGGTVLSRTPCNRIERFGEMIHDQRTAIEDNNIPYVITGNWASPRDVLLEVGLFDESLQRGQDVDLSWRIHRAGYRFVYQPRARVFHRNEHTLWGLVQEGFVHGVHGVRVRDKHLALEPRHGLSRGTSPGKRLGRDLRQLARKGDRINASLRLLFDMGKTSGELLARARPPKSRDGVRPDAQAAPSVSDSNQVTPE